MFSIYDGRDAFYQWDLDRRIIIEDESVEEVHFCNRADGCSLICKVYEYEGKRVADVPNILLQESWGINVYAYDEKYTKYNENFKVIARAKPSDYVYTKTEVWDYKELENKIEELEKKGITDEQISAAVESYLEKNTIEHPVTSVNNKTGEVVLTAEDVGALPDTTEIPSLEGYATETYVTNAINNASLGTEIDLSGYALKTDIPVVPTNVSVFTNDAGYLTEHQDLSSYALKTDIPDFPDMADYAKKTDIPDVSNFTTITEIEAKGYQTEEQVQALIEAKLPSSGEEVYY